MQQPMQLADLKDKINVQELQARFETVRRSEYFPAILGAVAGGLTGAVMAGLISGSRKEETVRIERTDAAGQKGIILGFSAKDLVQLTTVVAGLVRQMQEWRQNQQY